MHTQSIPVYIQSNPMISHMADCIIYLHYFSDVSKMLTSPPGYVHITQVDAPPGYVHVTQVDAPPGYVHITQVDAPPGYVHITQGDVSSWVRPHHSGGRLLLGTST